MSGSGERSREGTRPQPAPPAGSPAAFEAYAVRMGGCHVLLGSPQSCLDVLRSLQQSIVACRRQGVPAPPRVLYLITLLEFEIAEHRERTSAKGNAEVPQEPDLPPSLADDPVSVEEAARMLGVSRRQVRNLGEQLEGRKVAGSWLFDRDVVAAEAARRAHETRRSA